MHFLIDVAVVLPSERREVTERLRLSSLTHSHRNDKGRECPVFRIVFLVGSKANDAGLCREVKSVNSCKTLSIGS